MRYRILIPLLALATMNAYAADKPAQPKTALVIHGGAGFVPKDVHQR